jgi:hypothetical protein
MFHEYSDNDVDEDKLRDKNEDDEIGRSDNRIDATVTLTVHTGITLIAKQVLVININNIDEHAAKEGLQCSAVQRFNHPDLIPRLSGLSSFLTPTLHIFSQSCTSLNLRFIFQAMILACRDEKVNDGKQSFLP